MSTLNGSEKIQVPENTQYTPTTNAIRRGYSHVGIKSQQRKEAFDRWLAEVKAEAWEQGATTIVATIVMNGSNDMPRNPYRQGESSGNGASQSPVESSNLLNGGEEQ